MSRRIFCSLVSLILVVSLLCVNVFGTSPGTIGEFSRLRFVMLDTTYHYNDWEWKLIDEDEFLNYVTLLYNLNLDFYDNFYDVPFSIQKVEFYKTYNVHLLVPTMRYGTFTAKRSGWVSLNGWVTELTQNQTITFGSDNNPFPSAYQVNGVHQNSTSNVYNYLLGCDADGYILAYESGSESNIENIMGTLDDIIECLDTANLQDDVRNSFLRQLYGSLTDINLGLPAVATKLQNIRSYLNTITSTITDVYNNITQLDSDLLDGFDDVGNMMQDIDNHITVGFNNLDFDLDQIEGDLSAFAVDFGHYAYEMIQNINSIKNDVSNINSTLTDINDHLNGEALKTVQVGDSNLFSVIYSALRRGMNGIGSLFSMLFNAVGYFSGQAANGFNYFDNIDTYESVVYNPTDLTRSG